MLDVLCGGLLYPRAVYPSLSLVQFSANGAAVREWGIPPVYSARSGSVHVRVLGWVLVRPHTRKLLTCALCMLPLAPRTRETGRLPLVQGPGQGHRIV